MTEYTTLDAAIEGMDIGDTIESDKRGFVFFMDDDETLRFHGKTGQEVHLKRPLFKLNWKVIKSKKEMVSAVEVTEACLKSNGREGDPSSFEVSLVTEGEKNRDLLYAGLMKRAQIVVVLNERCNLIKENNMIHNLSKELDKINAVLNPNPNSSEELAKVFPSGESETALMRT